MYICMDSYTATKKENCVAKTCPQISFGLDDDISYCCLVGIYSHRVPYHSGQLLKSPDLTAYVEKNYSLFS